MARSPEKQLAHYLQTPPTRQQVVSAIAHLIRQHELALHTPWYKRLWRGITSARAGR